MIFTSKLKQTYIDLRGVYLPADFVKENQITAGQMYSIVVIGLKDADLSGTVTAAYVLGGLAKMYRRFELAVGDAVTLSYKNGTITVDTGKNPIELPEVSAEETVFDKQKLRHIHIEPYRHVSFGTWTPKTETDVYMVFGKLSELDLTDYQYCCGASQELLNYLGFKQISKSKPDAIVIDRDSGNYLVAEFKVDSVDFSSNHSPEDTDVLICWHDSEKIRQKVPGRVLALASLIEVALEKGDIELA